ncbi:tetratricopeptide repeat protein [Phaeodactylibacter luteus]|uniref:Tetratricopeptide repeat protein n=1 Tax=Phaeodactylibacter luteus TaxID=1564516 RepID=A0A5C6RLF8_9BACT|nr:hypothetical protein [Phaeodactylibacter luteus]TXB62162.1 hypothetical protein FRY97_15370 [Phaeodactylibacter luteus]
MKKIWLLYLFALAFTSCQSDTPAEGTDSMDQDQLSESILALSATLKKQMDSPTLDTATAQALVAQSIAYGERFPKDSLTPRFLFEAAAVARGMGDFQQAVETWGHISMDYPDYEKAPESIFFQAFTYDNDLRDTSRARKYYEFFLEQHPKHPIAGDARMLLEIIKTGKTPEEVIREFQNRPQ